MTSRRARNTFHRGGPIGLSVPKGILKMRSALASNFTQRVAASRLVDASRLAQARAVAGDDETALSQYLISQGVLTRFQVRQLRAGARHFQVDKYVVVDFLGRGGNSIVLKARHTLMPGRYVALKTLDVRNLHHTEQALARFRREIDILSKLEHPNLVRALDVIHTRTQLYLVLEYIEGRDLASLVRECGPLPVPEAVGYAIQAARGLAFAHENGVVHRDLKPANLLLTRDGVLKISDLGLARFYEAGPATELTTKGCCLGTPEFMAPEQAEDASLADARSDVYSLGATLFHLLTAELPVVGSSQLQRLKNLLAIPLRPLADARPDLPARLAAIVDRMRARNPDERPASAEEVIALLEPFAEAKETPKQTRWDSRRRVALVLAILKGEMDLPEASARYGIPAAELERWRLRFLEGAGESLDPATPEDRPFAEYQRALQAKIGMQAVEIETLKKQVGVNNGRQQTTPQRS
jgi:serine/threonine protein kinase